MSNIMNFPMNDDWQEVIFALNEIFFYKKDVYDSRQC